MRKTIILLFCILFLTGCTNSDPISQITEATETAELSEAAELSETIDAKENLPTGEVVQIHAGEVAGNGVLWEMTEERLTILTAGHVLTQGKGEVKVVFPDGLTVQVTCYEIVKPDLAFLVIDAEQIPAEHPVQYQTVRWDAETSEQLQSEEKVVLRAFGTGAEPQLREGKIVNPWIFIEDFDSHMILAQIDVEQGMSGSGVFDCEGHFLGILCGKSEDGEAAVISLPVIQAGYATISEKF